MRTICINGEYLDEGKARISVLDEAVLGGIAVYETLRTYGGQIWQLAKHLERLRLSAEALDIDVDYSNAQISEMIAETVKRNGFKESRVRISLTKGESAFYGGDVVPSLIILVQEMVDFGKYERGVPVITFRVERISPKIKSCNLIPGYLARMAAKKAEAFESILIDHMDEVTEGSITNVFFVKDGGLITPADNILAGTTRDLLIELARSAKIDVEERAVHVSELGEMQECFLCNSIRGIVPVKEIADREISFNVGEGVTERMQKLFEEYIAEKN